MAHTSWGKRCRDQKRTIPVLVHADGAQVYRDSEFYVWSISSACVDSTHMDIIDAKFQVIKVNCLQMRDPGTKKGYT